MQEKVVMLSPEVSAIGQSHEYLRTRFNMEAAAEAQSIPEARGAAPYVVLMMCTQIRECF